MNGLDLFSGIGGLTKALADYVRPVYYCDIDPYCQAVLLSRIHRGQLPRAKLWDDVTTLQANRCGITDIDIIYGGFPCQDISTLGTGKGLEGKRSGLFFEIVRLAEEIKPTFLFLENVPAITTRGGVAVMREIASLGYDARFCVISAASVGAPHKRDRWFCLARHRSGRNKEIHTLLDGYQSSSLQQSDREIQFVAEDSGFCEDVAYSKRSRLSRRGTEQWTKPEVAEPAYSSGWPAEPNVARMADGIPFRVDRVRALGNSVVPAQAKEAFEILMGIK